MKTITDTNIGKHISQIKKWIYTRLHNTLLPLTGGDIKQYLTFGDNEFFIANRSSFTIGAGSVPDSFNEERPTGGARITFDKGETGNDFINGDFHCAAAIQNDYAEFTAHANSHKLTYKNKDIAIKDNIKELTQITHYYDHATSFYNAYQCGPFVFISIDIQVNNGQYNNTNGLMSGLPKPLTPVSFMACLASARTILRMAITEEGRMIMDDNNPNPETRDWVHGNVCYITYE